MALTFLTISLYAVFFTAYFSTVSPYCFKSTGAGFNLSTFNLSTLLFTLLQPLDTFFNLSISNSSTSDFKQAKSAFFSACCAF